MLAKIFTQNTCGKSTYVAREAFPIGNGEFAAPADGIGRSALFTRESARASGYEFEEGDVVQVYAAAEGVEATVGREASDGHMNYTSTQYLTFKKLRNSPAPTA